MLIKTGGYNCNYIIIQWRENGQLDSELNYIEKSYSVWGVNCELKYQQKNGKCRLLEANGELKAEYTCINGKLEILNQGIDNAPIYIRGYRPYDNGSVYHNYRYEEVILYRKWYRPSDSIQKCAMVHG